MVERNAPALDLDLETRRALQLDALAAILPMDRRDRLAELLTDDDVETLKHLAREGMGENSLRALASDLAYLEAWADAAGGQPLPWPATEALAWKFVAHHLWNPSKRETDPRHGMPADVAESLRAEGLLRCDGPHAPSGAWRAGALASVERDRGTVPGAEPALGAALGRPRLVAAAPAQEQAGRHPGCPRSADRNLRDRSSGRYPGSRDPSLGVRVRRAPAQ
jgi:hypothetical protein